jgi:tRNA nucleotidyltransferase (CCA-adding enzyme)
MALLVYRLTGKETDKLISYLHLPKAAAQVLRDTQSVKNVIGELSVRGLAPSAIYNILNNCGATALTAISIGAGSEIAAEHIQLYLNVLKFVNPVLTGEDLQKLGVKRGPNIKEILDLLREARLDGKIDSKKGEEAMVREWLKK